MIDISIIIANYNTKDLILQCIEAIVKLKPEISCEVVVVDNGSTDGSVGAIRKSIKGIRSTKGIKGLLIENKENFGFSRANNQGIRKAKGKYILLLNSDTKVRRRALKKLVEFAEKTPNAGVVGARLLNPDGSVQASCFNFPTIKNAVGQYWLGEKGLVDKFTPKGKKPQEVDVVSGAAFLITPKAREMAGLLDERHFMYFEDLDYCRRVWKSGLKVYYLPTSEVIHYHGASGGSNKLLVKSSKTYHGVLKHYLINIIIWSGQKWQKLLNRQN